ncbi:MAG: class I SAM-dependent methyltransferase [Eubacteriales bacterium]|nr:class I SAM-dependent methyltransferase [Eubacteriales bacterium]
MATDYKKLSISEFTKAAGRYEGDEAGIYETCKRNYPDIIEILEEEEFTDLLDAGCGPAPLIRLLSEKYPDKHYTGIDLTPKMIEIARAKNMKNAEFIVGDCEKLPFEDGSFDAIVCSESFHHYPNPGDFFKSAARCLRSGGRLIIRDYMADGAVKWFANHIEMPLVNLLGHGDYGVHNEAELRKMAGDAGLTVLKISRPTGRGFKVNFVCRK